MKVRRYRTFWVLILFFVVLLPLWALGIAEGMVKIGGGGRQGINLVSQAFNFSNVWQNIGYWTSIFVTLLSILIIILTTNEYQFRTNRQNVIDGWHRLTFYHAKWAMVLAISLFTVLYTLLVGLVFGFRYGTTATFPGSLIHLGYTWLLALDYFGFALLLSLFLKRSGITIGFFLLYSVIIETLLTNLINWATKSEAGTYLPLQASDELLPFPLMDIARALMGANQPDLSSQHALASAGWIIVYYFIGRQKLLLSDW